MEITKTQIQSFLKDHPEMKDRSQMAKAVEMITGVTVEKQVEAKTALRRLQEAIPNDTKGERLEKAWRKERGMQSGCEINEEVNSALLSGKTVNIGGVLYRVKV